MIKRKKEKPKSKSIVLTLIALIGVAIVAVPLWLYLGYWSFVICLALLVNVLVFVSYKNDVSIPLIGEIIKKEYHRVNKKLDDMKSDIAESEYNMYTVSFHFLFDKAYSRFLYYLLLISRDSQSSFGDVVGDSRPFGIRFDDRGSGGFDKMPDKVRQAYIEEYHRLHQIKQRKVSILSLAGTGIMVLATVVVSLTATLILPAAFDSEAATYGWNQNDWSGTISQSSVGISHTDWTNYYQKDDSIDAGKVLSIKLGSFTLDFDDGRDFSSGDISGINITSGGLELDKDFDLGRYQSEVFDLSGSVGFGSVRWDGDVYQLKARTFDLIDRADANDWEACDALISGQDISLNNCITDGDRYLQYLVEFDGPQPFLEDLSFVYEGYPSEAQTLISSPIDTGQDSNIVREIFWTEGQYSQGEIRFQLRTSSDGDIWTDWLGPEGEDSFYIYGDLPQTINLIHRDGLGDRYVQYKVFLTVGDGGGRPILRDFALTVDNKAPGPVINNIKYDEVSADKINIYWDTSIPAISMVEYGLYEGGSTAVKMEKDFSTSHYFGIDGLKSDTEYYFKIICEDDLGNFAESPEYYFETL